MVGNINKGRSLGMSTFVTNQALEKYFAWLESEITCRFRGICSSIGRCPLKGADLQLQRYE
ncbi:hypothetical protein JCM15765_02520 [Paradesulfitobacterium aromaticivorans]